MSDLGEAVLCAAVFAVGYLSLVSQADRIARELELAAERAERRDFPRARARYRSRS